MAINATSNPKAINPLKLNWFRAVINLKMSLSIRFPKVYFGSNIALNIKRVKEIKLLCTY